MFKHTLALISLCLITLSANATVYKFNFTGEIYSIVEYIDSVLSTNKGDHNFHSGRYSIDQALSGSFTFDSAIPANNSSSNKVTYNNVNAVSLTIGEYTYSIEDVTGGHTTVWDDYFNKDKYILYSGNIHTVPFVMGSGSNTASIDVELIDTCLLYTSPSPRDS